MFCENDSRFVLSIMIVIVESYVIFCGACAIVLISEGAICTQGKTSVVKDSDKIYKPIQHSMLIRLSNVLFLCQFLLKFAISVPYHFNLWCVYSDWVVDI